jgi:hypothetical protein
MMMMMMMMMMLQAELADAISPTTPFFTGCAHARAQVPDGGA